MKKSKLLLSALVVFMMSNCLRAQSSASEGDKIIGVWLTEEGKGRIQITKYGDKYGGKIIWLKVPNDDDGKPKVDKHNPDIKKRNVPLLGLSNLLGFTYEGDNKYENGTIYDPKDGKTYKCNITFEGNDVLKVRGFIGFSLIGKTQTWTRVK